MEKMALPGLYALMAKKIEEMKILSIQKSDDPDYRVRRLEIEAIQKIIESKKNKPERK